MDDPQKYEKRAFKKKRVLCALWMKFNDFREHPNAKQRIKFDVISEHLKRFFMEKIDDKDVETGKNQWRVSFAQITLVYPNAQVLVVVASFIMIQIIVL